MTRVKVRQRVKGGKQNSGGKDETGRNEERRRSWGERITGDKGKGEVKGREERTNSSEKK